MLDDQDPGRTRQREIFVAGLSGDRPRISTNADRLEAQARAAMSPEGWAYISGGAGPCPRGGGVAWLRFPKSGS